MKFCKVIRKRVPIKGHYISIYDEGCVSNDSYRVDVYLQILWLIKKPLFSYYMLYTFNRTIGFRETNLLKGLLPNTQEEYGRIIKINWLYFSQLPSHFRKSSLGLIG